MRLILLFVSAVYLISTAEAAAVAKAKHTRKAPIIIDHRCLDIQKIPAKLLKKAASRYKVWYGHTSHGSQITSGMSAMNQGLFKFSKDEANHTLSYQETGGDLGHKGNLGWAQRTKKQLDAPDNDRNLVMWSWCGGVSDNTEEGINAYLQAMNELEQRYPQVTFIYMTGHLDGTGVQGNLHQRNEQIRTYCRKNNKVLFDFADIESYDPDGRCFLQKQADDGCKYVINSNGKRYGNWATEWIKRHPDHGWDLPQRAAHTHPLNGAMKARAFWYMLAVLANQSD